MSDSNGSAGFRAERLSERVWRIVDPLGVGLYLVVGAERAALLDTGCGVPGLRACVETITDRPVTVWLTHGHVDHAMGAGEFGEAYLSPADAEVFRGHGDSAFRQAFAPALGYRGALVPGLAAEALLPLADGDVLDLGGVGVRAIAAPGHTPGTMAFLIAGERMLLLGDACGPGTILLERWSADIEEYRAALVRLRGLNGAYDRILRNHGSFVSPLDLVENVIAVCDDIIAGTDDRIELPQKTVSYLPGYDPCPVYRAKATEMVAGEERRVDGVHGNVSYRADKAPWYRTAPEADEGAAVPAAEEADR